MLEEKTFSFYFHMSNFQIFYFSLLFVKQIFMQLSNFLLTVCCLTSDVLATTKTHLQFELQPESVKSLSQAASQSLKQMSEVYFS